MVWPLSQHRLHGPPLQLADARLEAASLFPFFDDQGMVQGLMVIWPASNQVVLLDADPDLFRTRFLQPPRLDINSHQLTNATEADARRLADCWHFDPWRALADDRFAGHPAVPILKSTNIPGFDARWGRVWFDRRLRRVRMVKTQKDDGNPDVAYFKPAMLERADERRRAQQAGSRPSTEAGIDRHGTTWRLRPFWHS